MAANGVFARARAPSPSPELLTTELPERWARIARGRRPQTQTQTGLQDVAPGGIGDGILLFCPPGFCDVGGLLRALSSSGG